MRQSIIVAMIDCLCYYKSITQNRTLYFGDNLEISWEKFPQKPNNKGVFDLMTEKLSKKPLSCYKCMVLHGTASVL
ncbi:MAG: hypothetical protein A2W41_00430 [Candidatus Ryanbacteria bacterium RIFCSPHIGHO2_01_45_13]|uniref:Uncharacterized protein n=1 Tax=Candidatus Ryanbacteria bacterium RIFCSPHIGHO2_01_45_13 TaxID=1802112 RepID=A0A1G2FZ86_9BACT|nr:MAG: hypothetical protein A2W41_00430 [Candidatus Ryanbacteria bacterium RIFCSPHIGHO2_01_45_13]